MATESALHDVHEDVHHGQEDWSGGDQPMKASYGKLMMWYFLLSDAFTFAGFLIAYGTLRISMDTWPEPDFVFSTFPFGLHHKPLYFVSVMTFILLFSSYTMVRAVQEGKEENKNGVVFWMLLTILGGAAFLGCQAWEWNTLINGESVTLTTNPFGRHVEAGVYLDANGKECEVFDMGHNYLIHVEGHAVPGADHAKCSHSTYAGPGDYPDAVVDDKGYIHRKYKVTEGDDAGMVKTESFGPKAFGALFFFITGFHGFHVFSGVVFLIIIMLNAASGLYARRKNGYEMVEKIGLYWHFVDLVWVFVFLVFYLI
ncbi:MAG: cytochrome c oxidase subunit 3 [Bacteroidota bacterium]